MPELSVSDFRDWFRAVHGSDPFPWQQRLLETIASEGRWPRALDLPTGVGKTAAIDVALFHLALEARHAERRAPTRTVLVVDRRTIVDQAYQRAIKIRRALNAAEGGVVGRVSNSLASLSTEGRALDVAILRGGIARDDGWVRSPSQPLIVLSTVDQVGSRFLFRGYGVSQTMQPIHAAMVGEDALLLLDEVHLSTPFLQTLDAVAERYGGWADQPLPRRWQVVSMSATGDGGGFQLDRRDEENSSLRKRLHASKPVLLREVTAAGSEDAKAEKFARTLADAAVSAADPGKTVAVVVNRVGTARRIFEKLRSSNANA